MRPGNKQVVGVIGGLVVVGVCAGAAWWLWGASAAPVETPVATAKPTPLTEAEAAASALRALGSDPASLLPAELEGELRAEAREAVPAGTTIVADTDSWMPSSMGGGVIEAILTYPDGASERLGIVMVEEDDGWKVLQTIPLGDAQ